MNVTVVDSLEGCVSTRGGDMKAPSWQVVVLILVFTAIIVGSAVFLISFGHAPPSFLPELIQALLVAVPIAIITYLRGQTEMPKAPPGFEWKAIKSVRPPSMPDIDIDVMKERDHEKDK